MGKMTAV